MPTTMNSAPGAKHVPPFGGLDIRQDGNSICFTVPVADPRNGWLAAEMAIVTLIGLVATYYSFMQAIVLLLVIGGPAIAILIMSPYEKFVWLGVRPDGLIINTNNPAMDDPVHARFLEAGYIRTITVDFENGLTLVYGAVTIEAISAFTDEATCDLFSQLFKKTIAQAWRQEDVAT